MLKLLSEKQIWVRIVGKDSTDSRHWASYLRRPKVCCHHETGRKWAGIWKIQNNKLCTSSLNLEGSIAMKFGCAVRI